MTDAAAARKRALGAKTDIQVFSGQIAAVTATGFTVQVSTGATTGQFPALPGSDYLPAIAENVIVWFIDDIAFVMGPDTPNPAQGTVVSVAAGLVTLTPTFGPTIACPYASTLTPTAGQVMQITWANGPFAIAVLSTSPTPANPPSGGGSGPTKHADTFTALDSGSYQSNWWTNRVYDSSTNIGMWFYGSKISDTIPSGAAISRVQMFVDPVQLFGSSPIFGLHGYMTKPGGAPSSVSSATTVGVGGAGWVDLPVGFGNALKSGGGSYGIGTNHGGYNIFTSRAEDGQSGALKITSSY